MCSRTLRQSSSWSKTFRVDLATDPVGVLLKGGLGLGVRGSNDERVTVRRLCLSDGPNNIIYYYRWRSNATISSSKKPPTCFLPLYISSSHPFHPQRERE